MNEHRLQRKIESTGTITKMMESRDGGFMASKDKVKGKAEQPGQGKDTK